MAAAPNAFSAHLEKWIVQQTKDSIFFVNISPNLDFKSKLEDLMEKAKTVPVGERAEALNPKGKCAGSVVEVRTREIIILSSAHLMEHVYTVSKPLSVRLAKTYFHTDVLCDHYEVSFSRPGQHTHTKRKYASATIIGIDCEQDLLLISVPRVNLKNLDSDCSVSHPPLTFSSVLPVQLDECIMLSWPPLQHRTVVKGSICHISRALYDLVKKLDNPVGYGMRLLQVTIASENGSSGAPLLDGRGKVIGILHGGSGGPFSYFVKLRHIIPFLTKHGIVARQG
ncbi:hypothetical protein CFC21_098281 [Triticum aestivum]|uniref:Uncharacterized protein n=3 Tax=Triticum TaxID=4564 RepID=A0A9R0ZGI9_TRITD|nr:hypothetical protein CFC21_098281 [Triticum aestivum]VAI76485.1 unnamed protein product [Triticum turgidum subsp. durum]